MRIAIMRMMMIHEIENAVAERRGRCSTSASRRPVHDVNRDFSFLETEAFGTNGAGKVIPYIPFENDVVVDVRM